MTKTRIAMAIAASLTLFAAPLAAENAGTGDGGQAAKESPGAAQENTSQGGDAEDLPGLTAEDQEAFNQTISMDAEQAMREFDLDDDGELSEAELTVFGATAGGYPPETDPGKKLLEELDQDDDGTVNEEELARSELIDSQ